VVCFTVFMFILTFTSNAYPKVRGFEGKVNILLEGIYDTIFVEVYVKSIIYV